MKVATWNIERLKHKKNLNDIVRLCNEQHADILVLTETDEQVRPDFKYGFHTPRLSAYPLVYHYLHIMRRRRTGFLSIPITSVLDSMGLLINILPYALS